MKTIIRLLSAAAVLCCTLALSSCNNEDFLTTTQYDIVAGDAMFENDANAKMGMTGIYKMMNPNDATDGDWGFKPNLMVGCHPTCDTQATGWDKDWMVQNWNAGSTELGQGWAHCYHGISRANEFLAGLETSTNVSPAVKAKLEGEARAVRAFFYMWLGTAFGRVPMLSTGESYVTDPQKARAETYVEMWDFIINDLEEAVKLLDWQPMDGEYGRATKGMALAYLGDAYMWKAYRVSDGANGQTQDKALATQCYQAAYDAFKQIINSGTYELSRSFTTNWDPAGVWNKETIWVEVLDEGDNASKWETMVSRIMIKWYTACQANGGWGSEFLSWEWWSAYEPGDKRREGSACTGAVPQINPDCEEYDPQYAGWYVPAVWGQHPYLREPILKPEEAQTAHFHNNFGEPAPSIWTMKLWRTASACDELGANSWGHDMWSTTPIYWKRYANVLIDCAECCFRLSGKEQEGWGYLDQLRNRAFGNLEVGHKDELTAKFLPYYQKLAAKNFGIKADEFTEYPIPFNVDPVQVTPAETYYTALKAKKNFSSPVWKVAVNEERRKEFCSEWCLRPDMQRSGYLADHIEHNYPKQSLKSEELTDWPWSNRAYDYSEQRMDMPIPAGELSKNKLCDQNPGY